MKVLLNEIFYSIQGEGPNMGKPAVFVRLGGCNLKCTWCDSRFTWDPKLQDNFQSSTEEITEKIKKYPCKHLVITGGEPMLQQKAIKEILQALPGHTAEIETNGSIPCQISDSIEQINCSPKLKNSGNKTYPLKIKPSNEKAIFKFVIQKKSDLEEVKIYIKKNKIPKNKVWLMPEGVDSETIKKRSKWLVEICKKEGLNFSPRLHVMLFENERAK